MNRIIWYQYAVDYVLRGKIPVYRKKKYCKRDIQSEETVADILGQKLEEGKPFAAGRIGLFELAAMRMYEFNKKDKYALVMDNIYNCAGFFPNDITLGYKFLKLMEDALSNIDILGCNRNLCENYFIDYYMSEDSIVAPSFDIYENTKLESPWSPHLAGKKVLVITPFSKSVELQYQKRKELFPGQEILPEFELQTYQSLLTVGELKDARFPTWFEALDFMKEEILMRDFDVALLGCGAYGFPLASMIKQAGKQAIHMGGVLQILFGIMGRRWDGSQPWMKGNMRADIAKYYNESWIYPIEEMPSEAKKVEYGPYWK